MSGHTIAEDSLDSLVEKSLAGDRRAGRNSGRTWSATGRSPAADREVEAAQLREHLVRAIELLGRESPRCGIIFRRILESLDRGGSKREISARSLRTAQADIPGITRGNFYVILHRCRARLRELLGTLEGEGET